MITGNQLKKIREHFKLLQSDFYYSIGFFPSYGNSIERHYGNKPIPKKMEEMINKKYPTNGKIGK